MTFAIAGVRIRTSDAEYFTKKKSCIKYWKNKVLLSLQGEIISYSLYFCHRGARYVQMAVLLLGLNCAGEGWTFSKVEATADGHNSSPIEL